MNVGRRRKTNKHLPARVYRKHGAYYFVDLEMKWHRLGVALGEAYHVLATFCPDEDQVRTMNDLADRYQREIIPSYKEKRQKDKAKHMERIRAALGHMPLEDVTAGVVRAFRDKVGKRAGRGWKQPALANRTLGTLSHMFSMACEWDIATVNPCRDVLRPKEPKRTRYIEDEEFRAVHSYCPPMHQIAMELALLTGLRREDILNLTRDSVTDDGLLVHTGKTDKPLLFQWSDELRDVIKRAQAMPPHVRRHVICNRQGKGYTPDGFSAIWRRARAKAMKEGKLTESYRFNDLRAKSASDDADVEVASQRLGHTSRQTTEQFYIRTPRIVQPLR
jgi:integrase